MPVAPEDLQAIVFLFLVHEKSSSSCLQ